MVRGHPYRYSSAAVKLNRPVGIAVMALLSKFLQYVPRRMAKPRNNGAAARQHNCESPVNISAKRGENPFRACRREGRCGCRVRVWGRATEVPVLVGV